MTRTDIGQFSQTCSATAALRTSSLITHFREFRGVGAAETQRAETGWVDPKVFEKTAGTNADTPFQLRNKYFPGDIGFDPLGLKPEDPAKLQELQTKELQHGRLAMLATAGFVAQELVDGQGVIAHFANLLS